MNTGAADSVKSGVPRPAEDAGVVPVDCWTREEILAFRDGRRPRRSSSTDSDHAGTYSRYTHGCRCSSCREAARLHKRDYLARRALAAAS